MAYSKRPSPHAPFHPNTTLPSKVQPARVVIEQCIKPKELDDAEVAIGFGSKDVDAVPALRDGESLFTDQEIDALVTASTKADQSDSLVNILGNEHVEKEYEDKVRDLVEQVLQKWTSIHVDAPAVLKTVNVRPKRTLPQQPLELRTSENAMKRTTYERGLEDIEIGVVIKKKDHPDKERTILIIEMKRHYDTSDYRRLESATESTTSDKQSLIDVVKQCMLYSMKTQRSILRTESSFVLVSLALFKEAAFLIKLTANEWWSYLYKLDVRKFEFQRVQKIREEEVEQDKLQEIREQAEKDKLQRARDVLNILQVLISRVLVVNAETNALFSDTLYHDFIQLELPNYLVEYPSYPPDAHVQALPNVRANHIRMCSLTDCVQTLIRSSEVYWPSFIDPDVDKTEWCSKLEQEGTSIQVVAKVVSALNYCCPDGVPKHLKDLLNAIGLMIQKLERRNSEGTAKYFNLLDLHVCITSRKENENSSVVVTKFKGENVRACASFLSNWTDPTGGARDAFFEQVCNVCIGMLEDGLKYYHGDLRPANISVLLTKQEASTVASTSAADDASTKPKATEQNHYLLTVIDWDDVCKSGKFRTKIKGDNFYPYATCTVATKQLASAVYTAYQLLVCIYILHRAAKATSHNEDGLTKANEIEFNLRYCKPIFTTMMEASASEAKLPRLEDTASTNTAANPPAMDISFLHDNPTPVEQAKQNEYGSFQKWIRKMGENVFSDLNAFLTDQRRCTFDLLRSHLRVAIHTDLDE